MAPDCPLPLLQENMVYYTLRALAETLLQKMMYTEPVFCKYCMYVQIPVLTFKKSWNEGPVLTSPWGAHKGACVCFAVLLGISHLLPKN